MKKFCLAAMFAFVVTGCSAGSEPSKLWELAGFDAPESALLSPDGTTLYVSNIAGAPDKKDGVGFIAKVTPDGKLTTLKWVEGLDAPKGLAITDGKLYVADIDQLVEIDIASGKISARYQAAGAKFLNDVAADKDGNVYVSDTVTNKIWRLADGKFDMWLDSVDLMGPNGLLVQGDKLIVAAWGVMTGDGFKTKVSGHLLSVSLTDKSIKALGDGSPLGNLDGLEPLGDGNYLVSDWMTGKVLRVAPTGKAGVLVTLSQGAADLGFAPATRTMFLPLTKDGKVVAYHIP